MRYSQKDRLQKQVMIESANVQLSRLLGAIVVKLRRSNKTVLQELV